MKTGRRQPAEKLTLLYDAECILCLASVEKLRHMKSRAELVMVPLQSAPEDVLPKGVTKEELLAELHLIDEDGRLYRGAASVVRIMRTVPSLAWLASMYRVPGLKGLADTLYKWIAKHRYRLFGKAGDTCAGGACRLQAARPSGSEQQETCTTDKGDHTP
jgi:predicted DCC family thiol-disulfide oxidoreductase YuxK